MDKATFFGFLGAAGLVAWAMHMSLTGGETAAYAFLNVPGLILVVFGSLFCTMMSVPMPTFRDSWRIAGKVIFWKEQRLEQVVQKLVDLATKARHEGVLTLESELAEIKDPFLAKALQMVIDGQQQEEVETSLRVELHALGARHKMGKKFFLQMSVYAPGYGLICTLIGQCVMFRNMGGGGDIGKIGGGMAVALLGTLYGVLTCNLFCLPFADKLEARSAQEMLVKELYLQGVLAIAAEDSPIVLKQKLLAFLDNHSAERLGSGLQ